MQAEIEELIEIIEANEAKYDALITKLDEPVQPDLESRAMQAVALGNRDERFHEWFRTQVEGSKGFDFVNLFTKIGQGVAKIGAAIKAAVQKKKAAKAAAAAAAKAKAATSAGATAGAPSPGGTNKGLVIAGVIIGLLAVAGTVYLLFFAGEEAAKTKVG